ncbi:carboxypeptidase regulatory-like domain-containing protein [Rhizobiaceae bacterium n13]|uniref:Carboxypeptidase regulatory-like domain-containing protein n=1 Tax=Ferirhizobium litorale TaxID=2927786 RepID=A0AAE3U214_9HYPH|nr:carboxypeptidase regulatory-like domain-containing protein [Fererhizobium litorale]MDI7863214.1 carboxypeptidase regulatory-like domain-containing protein [Fererhizobium litorale]MDI7923051.1 carboxypeptidase regulatory-like domain-containing protein [Fererhizobium litorale]
MAVLAATLSGCVTAPEPKSKFDPSEAAFIHAQGAGSITGQAFLRRNDGMVVYAAGSEVYLIPKTTYADERIAGLYRGAKFNGFVASPKNTDPQYAAMMRKTKADGEGRFAFQGLADGSYYIVTQVFWKAGDWTQGGSLMETATISAGNSISVIMSGQ